MGIRDRGVEKTVSRKEIDKNQQICRSKKNTIVFSFKNLTTNKNYCGKFQQEQVAVDFFNKLRVISELTWEQFHQQGRKSGYELLSWGQIDCKVKKGTSLPITDDEKIYIIRFNSQNARMLVKRGTKCQRVANVIAIDTELLAYRH